VPTSRTWVVVALAAVLAGCEEERGVTTPTAPPPPRPLAWATAPESIVVRAGESKKFTATLTLAVPAVYEITSSSARVAVAGESDGLGVFRGTVAGIETGEATVTLKATASGYTTATSAIRIEVERPRPAIDHRFVRWFWDELVFDMHDCPDESACPDYYTNGDPVPPLEDRHMFVLPSPSPNIYIQTETPTGLRGFSSSQKRRLRQLIPAAISALTGTSFTGRIEEGSAEQDRFGWISIVPVRKQDDPETWGRRDDGRIFCGRARTGWDNGRVRINLDAVRSTSTRGYCLFDSTVLHEMGHALGFTHVSDASAVMAQSVGNFRFSSRERYHGQLAYQFGRHTIYRDAALTAGGKRGPDRWPRGRPRGPVVTCGLSR